jgi:hypothetical protein
MATLTAREVYEKHIRPLPQQEQEQLVELIQQEGQQRPKRPLPEIMAEHGMAPTEKKHRITELHGLGAEIWAGVDAQEYVNKLRDEWDEPR